MLHRYAGFLGAFAAPALLFSSTALAQSITGLGFLPSYSYSGASGISTNGAIIVVGTSSAHADGDCSDNCQGFYWSNGAMTGLGYLGTGNASAANAISADGKVIVGTAHATATPHSETAFRFVGGTMTAIPLIAGHTCSSATAVNGDGSVVVGQAWTCSVGVNYQAFVWNNGVVSPLGFLIGDSLGSANGVSGDGTIIVGNSYNSGGPGHAVKWVNGIIAALGTLPGDQGSNALGISYDGTAIVGYSSTDPFGVNPQAVEWAGGSITGLGFLPGATFSYATAANYNGAVVVGVSGSGPSNTAFRWSAATGMQSIATWLGPTVNLAGIVIDFANGVSADGSFVVGRMQRNGKYEGYLAQVGGLLTLSEVPGSFASTAQPSQSAARRIEDAGAGESVDCRTFGPTGTCAFANGRAVFGDEGVSETGVDGVVGVAKRLTPLTRAGVAIGAIYDHTSMTFGGRSSAFAPNVTLFAGAGDEKNLGPQFFASTTYGHFFAAIDRGYSNGASMVTSNGDTAIDVVGGRVRLGWNLMAMPGLITGPFAELAGVHAVEAAYAEKGGPFPASFASRHDSDLASHLGLQASAGIGGGWELFGSAAWDHRLAQKSDPVFGSIPTVLAVSVTPARQSTDWAELKAGVTDAINANTKVSLSAAGDLGHDARSLSVRAGFQMGF